MKKEIGIYVLGLLLCSGCDTTESTLGGAMLGTAAGAGIGHAVGGKGGAALGGVLGGLGGAGLGHHVAGNKSDTSASEVNMMHARVRAAEETASKEKAKRKTAEKKAKKKARKEAKLRQAAAAQVK